MEKKRLIMMGENTTQIRKELKADLIKEINYHNLVNTNKLSTDNIKFKYKADVFETYLVCFVV